MLDYEDYNAAQSFYDSPLGVEAWNLEILSPWPNDISDFINTANSWHDVLKPRAWINTIPQARVEHDLSDFFNNKANSWHDVFKLIAWIEKCHESLL